MIETAKLIYLYFNWRFWNLIILFKNIHKIFELGNFFYIYKQRENIKTPLSLSLIKLLIQRENITLKKLLLVMNKSMHRNQTYNPVLLLLFAYMCQIIPNTWVKSLNKNNIYKSYHPSERTTLIIYKGWSAFCSLVLFKIKHYPICEIESFIINFLASFKQKKQNSKISKKKGENKLFNRNGVSFDSI